VSKILVTGASGFIGSHTCLSLLRSNYKIIAMDNLRNSSKKSLETVSKIANQNFEFIEGDVCNASLLRDIFKKHKITSVIHFAGLKAVGESVELPIDYFENNVGGTIQLCKVMDEFGVRVLIFSSSCTIYGNPQDVPVTEECPSKTPTNPYGRSKLMVEQILSDIAKSNKDWKIALLRYFNPVGADKSGLIGEDPKVEPNNLFPYISQVAVGKLSKLKIFGNDYATHDGTGVRDYIHVTDLAEGHIAALKKILNIDGIHAWNLGTGKGYSVMDVLRSFQDVTNIQIKYSIMPRRPGDIDKIFSNPAKANKELGWFAKRDLREMVNDSWKWQSKFPNGFQE